MEMTLLFNEIWIEVTYGSYPSEKETRDNPRTNGIIEIEKVVEDGEDKTNQYANDFEELERLVGNKLDESEF